MRALDYFNALNHFNDLSFLKTVVESKEESRRKKRQFRSQVCLALDVDKHVLRQMKGRRLEKMKPGVYRSTLSSIQPVVIEKTWQEPTAAEQDKHHSVHKLQVEEIQDVGDPFLFPWSHLHLQLWLYSAVSIQ